MRQIDELHAVQHAFFGQLRGDQLHAPAREQLHVHGSREAQHARDLLRRLPVGVDRHGKPQIVLQHIHMLGVRGVSDARDRVLRADLVRHQAGKEVQFVAVRHGKHQIRVLRADRFQHRIDRAVADVADHILRGADLLDHRFVLIDDRDLVSFLQQLHRKGRSHLAAADDDNLHVCSSCRFLRNVYHIRTRGKNQVFADFVRNSRSFFRFGGL